MNNQEKIKKEKEQNSMKFEIMKNGARGIAPMETLLIQAWGKNAIRVRATKRYTLKNPIDALKTVETAAVVTECDGYVCIENGSLSCRAYDTGFLEFYKDGDCILREYCRDHSHANGHSAPMLFSARKYEKLEDGYKIQVRFEGKDGEKIFGMGQYQQDNADLKGCILELRQRNSQLSIPFYLSNFGYGFLWNNASIGEVMFGNNYTQFTADCTECIDYWIVAGDSPKDIIKNYTEVTGRPPLFPENMMGLWQCKLRYSTQEELLSVAREYKNRKLPLDAIVIDYFHWTAQGDWAFDPNCWPDPKAMVEELKEQGVKVVVSVWPTADRAASKNYAVMEENGWLVKSDCRQGPMHESCKFYDAFNVNARNFVWEQIKKNYFDKGVKTYWLDADEPEYYDIEAMRQISYCKGKALKVGNAYPNQHLEGIYTNMKSEGENDIVNLTRATWVGGQKYAALVWSGDVKSNWVGFRDQVVAGLQMGIAGIPWWTTDIGGFMKDGLSESELTELIIRWYQFAVFSPVLRMHGDRGPITGGTTYKPNEIWSYGEEAYSIMKKYLDIRIQLKPYLFDIYKQASETGLPLLRMMFLEFPEDENCWTYKEQYMLGSKYLVAPVLYAGIKERTVYLPKGKWKDFNTQNYYDGEQEITVKTPIDIIPVFEKCE